MFYFDYSSPLLLLKIPSLLFCGHHFFLSVLSLLLMVDKIENVKRVEVAETEMKVIRAKVAVILEEVVLVENMKKQI